MAALNRPDCHARIRCDLTTPAKPDAGVPPQDRAYGYGKSTRPIGALTAWDFNTVGDYDKSSRH
jgi:hypothetical protein